MVEEAGCGLVIEYGNLEDLENTLDVLASDPEYRNELGQNGRRAYEQHFSWDEMQTRLLDLYRAIEKNNR